MEEYDKAKHGSYREYQKIKIKESSDKIQADKQIKYDKKAKAKSIADAKNKESKEKVEITKQAKKHIKKEVDVVACYIQPEQLWFLLPLKVVTGRTTRLSTDQTTKSKYQKYRENWSIFYE